MCTSIPTKMCLYRKWVKKNLIFYVNVLTIFFCFNSSCICTYIHTHTPYTNDSVVIFFYSFILSSHLLCKWASACKTFWYNDKIYNLGVLCDDIPFKRSQKFSWKIDWLSNALIFSIFHIQICKRKCVSKNFFYWWW